MQRLAWVMVGFASCSRPTPPPPAEPTAPSASEPRVDDATAEASNLNHDDPVVDDGWFQPLPRLTLGSVPDKDKAQLNRCLTANRIDQADVTPAELASAASCAAAVGAVGHEIRLLRFLVQRFPSVAEAEPATLRMGQAYEQIDVRPQAIGAYQAFVRKYPGAQEARDVGQRAVCLAWSLGDDAAVAELLATLEGHYGRKGFSRPSADALPTLCRRVPPLGVDDSSTAP